MSQEIERLAQVSLVADFDPAPQCVIVTGPRGAGKTRRLQHCVETVLASDPAARCAVVLAEEGRTRMERFAQRHPGLTLRKFALPCFCCPALAGFEPSMRALVAAVRPQRLFIELPALAAAGLLAEFDRAFGWPRVVLVCTDASWAAAQRAGDLSPFQSSLLGLAEFECPGAALPRANLLLPATP